MSKRLIAASLAAAFSFGTAFGLALSAASQNHAPTSAPARDDKLQTHKSPHQGLVCADGKVGQALCWPKDSTPPEGSNTICIQQADKTLCYTESPQTKPGLDM